MKNFKVSIFLFFLLISLMPLKSMASDWSLQIRGSYFYPTSKEVRDSYSRIWLDYQVEVSAPIYGNWQGWANVNWSSKKGDHRFGRFEEKTRLWILPISIGIKYAFPLLHCLNLYAGAGISYTFLRIEQEMSYFSDWGFTSSESVGVVGKSGLQWILSDYTFLDLFVDYYAHRFTISPCFSDYSYKREKLDLSGFKFGLGFGVFF